MRYKITKKDNKYYIRNTRTNKILQREFSCYEDAKQMLSIHPDVLKLEYILNQEMFKKLDILLADNLEIDKRTNWK